MRPAALALIALALAAPVARAAEPGPSARVQSIIAGMTLEEKVGQLQSAAPPIPRLGLAGYDSWSEGLHGLARNGEATVFPQAIGLAAAWDEELLRQAGGVVAREARAKFAAGGPDHGRYEGLTIWSPMINIDRDPRWGRGQESYGEDPYLTGRLAVGFIQGLQGPDPARPRVVAAPKHLAVHSGPEAGRHGFDVDVSPQDLEATYLPAFRMAVTEAKAGSVMCAYNALHGTPACASPMLLEETLRRDWGFQGYVVSDCDAVDDMTKFHFFRPDNAGSAAEALKAGTDLDCGYAYGELGAAVRRGLVSEAALDRALTRLLTARERLGALGGEPARAERIDRTAHAALALRAARESIVLLKNDRARLPLAPGLKLAVVGPNADALESLEANYHGVAADPVTPLAGLRAALGAQHVAYAQGSPIAEGIAVTVPETALRSPEGAVGLRGEYYDNLDFAGAPKLVRTDRLVAFDWDRVAPAAGVDPRRYAVRWTGELVPPGPGVYDLVANLARCFDCQGHDRVRLFVDDVLAFEDDGSGQRTEAKLTFADGRPRRIRFELVHAGQDQGVRLQWRAPAALQLEEARRAAASADVVVAFVGLSPDVEGEELRVAVPGFEGGDRIDLSLPVAQRRLIETVTGAGKPLVIVVMAGSAVALGDQARSADGVLYAWYPGQAGGRAIAETLLGRNNPGGRLPVTIYRSARELPPFTDYRMAGRTYRYFQGEPLYPFGHGLSYTRFAYSALEAPATLAAGEPAILKVTVRNAGARAGEEVAQVYLTPPLAPGGPRLSLVGFRRVRLKPGEAKELSFTLGERAFDSVDPEGRHAVEPGAYRLFVGGGQPGYAEGVTADLAVSGRKALPR